MSDLEHSGPCEVGALCSDCQRDLDSLSGDPFARLSENAEAVRHDELRSIVRRHSRELREFMAKHPYQSKARQAAEGLDHVLGKVYQ